MRGISLSSRAAVTLKPRGVQQPDQQVAYLAIVVYGERWGARGI